MQHSFFNIPLSQYAELIPLLNSKSSFNIFTDKWTHLQTARLPFFKYYRLLSAHTFSTTPPVTMHYLWNEDNNDIIKMDGTRDAVFDNLEKLGLILNESTVVPYVRFVLDSIWTDKGNLRLVENMDEIELSERPAAKDLRFLKRTIHPAMVSQTGDKYIIEAIIIYGTEVYGSTIALQPNGIFEFPSETELKAGLNCVRVIFLE